MGRPLNGTARVEELNATLRHVLGTDTDIPRDKWDRIVCRHYGIGIEMCQNLTRTGEVLGYWKREGGPAGGADGGRRPGTVRFLPTSYPQTPPPRPEATSSALASATTNPLPVPA